MNVSIFELIFWSAPLVGLILFGLLIAMLLKPNRRSGERSSGIQLLQERYARGEITREEYFERRAVLLGETHPTGAPPPTI